MTLAACCLQRLGIAPGDRVLLQSQHCPQFVIACYALFRLGVVVLPVSAMTTVHERRYYATDRGARRRYAAPCVART